MTMTYAIEWTGPARSDGGIKLHAPHRRERKFPSLAAARSYAQRSADAADAVGGVVLWGPDGYVEPFFAA